jgi:RNA polymerase sigma-70 factor (ECF subfamily)
MTGQSPADEPVAVSFEAIYEEHFRFVWRSLRRLGVPESDVADAVQDVFLVVHRRLGEFERRSKVSTWLYGICYRVARDRRRLAHVRRRVDDDGQIDERADDGADVAAAAERRQGLALLEAILDEMPMEQRAVFTLFELESMGGEAIAEALEIPVGTVYSRLRIAREQFRRSLGRLQARDRFRLAGGDGPAGEGKARAGAGGER